MDYRKDTGTFYIQDVYEGPGLKGVPRGTIQRLRVVALDYRAAAIGRWLDPGQGQHAEQQIGLAGGGHLHAAVGHEGAHERHGRQGLLTWLHQQRGAVPPPDDVP